MRLTARLALLLACIACAKSEPPPAPTASVPPPPPAWQGNLVACTPETCGSVGANYGSMSLESGDITVANDGLVTVRMRGFVDANGVRGADRQLQVFFGRFEVRGFKVVNDNPLLGTITTDGQGNFEGPVTTGAGTHYHFQRGAGLKGRFIVNQPGVRSLFLTESDYGE